MPKRPDPTPPNPIDDILGLLGRAVNAANGASNAVIRRAQGTPVYGGKTREKSGYAVEDALGTIFDTLTNAGTDIARGAHDADWSRGRSHKGKIGGRTVDQLGQYPSGGNWHHPEGEAGLSGVMNDVMRRMHSGMNTIDMEVMRPIKRTIAENNQQKEDWKKEKADLAIRTQQRSVQTLPNGLKMTVFEQRKSPAYPSGGNWFDPESESGLQGIITNAKRSMNSRNGNTKKRGSVEKANFGRMAENAARAAARLGEMGRGFGERIGRGLANINPMAGESMSALTRQGLAGTLQEYLRRNSRPPIDVNSQAGMNDYLQRMGRQFDVEVEVPPMARSPFTDSEMEFRRLDPELEPTKTNAFQQGYRVGKPKYSTSQGYRGIGGITSDLKDKRINAYNENMSMANEAGRGSVFADYMLRNQRAADSAAEMARIRQSDATYGANVENMRRINADWNREMRRTARYSQVTEQPLGAIDFNPTMSIRDAQAASMGLSRPDQVANGNPFMGFTPDEYRQLLDNIIPGVASQYKDANAEQLYSLLSNMNDYPSVVNATKGFTLKRAITKRAKKEPICDCGEPISQCKCSGHNHKSMQKGGMCKCGSGMMKSMCKCGGMGKSMLKGDMCKCGSGMSKSMCKCGSGMGKSMYKSMSGKMDADMAITPQKVSTSRSIKSSNKYFN